MAPDDPISGQVVSQWVSDDGRRWIKIRKADGTETVIWLRDLGNTLIVEEVTRFWDEEVRRREQSKEN